MRKAFAVWCLMRADPFKQKNFKLIWQVVVGAEVSVYILTSVKLVLLNL